MFAQLCILASSVQLLYVWAIVFGFDPIEFAGATRMAAALALDLWIAGAALWLMGRDHAPDAELTRSGSRRRRSSASGRRRRG
jgi:hypothetical protein